MKRTLPFLLCLLLLPVRAQERSQFAPPAPDDDLPGAGPTRLERGWFQGLWERKHRAWAERAEQDKGAVVFFGDSITQGWGDELGGHFGDLNVANRGISGDTTRGMLIRLRQDVIALEPAGVVMLMGTNDIEDDGDVADAVANVKAMLAALDEHNPELPIVFCRIFPSAARKKRPREKIETYNRAFDKLLKGDDNVTVLDTWSVFATSEGDAIPKYFPDLLHPNKDGYAVWAASLRPVLATLGFLETEPDNFEPEEGFELLFNGRDLSGWGFRPTPPRKQPRKPNPGRPRFVEIHEAVSFDGKTESDDGRYIAIAGRLVVTTPTEGRRIQQLWTTRDFEGDFELRLEFRATPNADSGIFIKGRQLQCRDYPLAGPYRNLAKYKPQDWNEIVIRVTGRTARCTCNGEVLEEAFEVPAKGPIGLEGDRGQMEYRRIRLRAG